MKNDRENLMQYRKNINIELVALIYLGGRLRGLWGLLSCLRHKGTMSALEVVLNFSARKKYRKILRHHKHGMKGELL